MNDLKAKRRGYLGLAAYVTSASFSVLLNRFGVSGGLHPVWLNVLRLSFSALLFWPALLLTRRGQLSQWREAPRKTKRITLLSGVMLALHFLSWTMALSHTDAVVVTSIWSCSTLFTVIGAAFFLHEKTPLAAVPGLLLACLGTVIAALGASRSHALGIVFAIVTSLSFSGYALCGRCVRGHFDALLYNTVINTVAAFTAVLIALIGGISPAGLDLSSIFTALTLCVVCTICGHALYNYALGFIKAQTANVISVIEVVTGPLLLFLVLGEAPAPRSIAGGALIVVGVLLYLFFEERSAKKHHG